MHQAPASDSRQTNRLWGHSLTMGIALLACLLMGASCQTQAPPVKINGRTYKPKANEFTWVQKARNAQKLNDLDQEKQAWEGLLQRYPKTAFLAEAQRRLGWIAYRREQWPNAIRLLEAGKPQTMASGAKRTELLWAYGVSLFKAGRHEESLVTMEGLYKSLKPSQQATARTMMLAAAKKTGNKAAELRWLATQLPTLPASEQAAFRERIKKTVNGQMSLEQLRKLYLQRGDDTLKFPYDLMALRLARVYCHVQDWSNCKRLVGKLLQEIPPTHEMFQNVRSLNKRVMSHSRGVKSNVIGVIYPKTGRGASIGRWVRNAIELARRKYPKVRVVELDSKSRPDASAKAVDTLFYKHRALAIFGPVFSANAMAAAHRAQQLGIPLMTIALREGVADIGPFVFRNNLTSSRMGRAMARFAVEKQGHRRFAVMFPNRASGQIQAAAFWKEVVRLGGKVVGAESYAPGISDFTSAAKRLVGRYHLTQRPNWYKLYRQIRHVKNAVQKNRLYKKLVKQFLPVTDFDAIFLPAEHYLQVAMLASSLAQQDVEVKLHYRFWEKQRQELYKKRNKPLKFIQLLGTNVWKNKRIFTLEPRNVIGSIFCVRYNPKSRKQIVRSFVRSYKRAFPGQTRDRDPIHVSAYAYDTMNLLLHIAAQESAPSSRDGYRKALLKVREFPGVTGAMSVQASGEVLAPIKYLMAHRKQYFKLEYTSKTLIP
ncbi:MAG: hypothetical protein EP343_29460 [Deltaproteobacteria bacterium]|nr:MAG: hypothetical protein EP343_29460 [Deltaproteobacteria bacterium]